jgi:hypothetical protein
MVQVDAGAMMFLCDHVKAKRSWRAWTVVVLLPTLYILSAGPANHWQTQNGRNDTPTKIMGAIYAPLTWAYSKAPKRAQDLYVRYILWWRE